MVKNDIYKIYSTALAITIILLFAFLLLNCYFDGSYWQNMQQSKSALTAEYCELDQSTHFFRQTINTYSNLFYFFLGMIVVLIGFYDRNNKQEEHQNPIQQFSSISILLGVCLIYLCLGSSFFHASLTWLGQRMDMNATYAVCISTLGISIYRYFYKENISSKRKTIFLILIILLIVVFIQIHLMVSSFILLPLLILCIIICTISNYIRNKSAYTIQFAILSLLFVIGAFVLRTLDVKKIGCNPTSFYQGHAIWHFFTGMSAFFIYWFYRSEQLKKHTA